MDIWTTTSTTSYTFLKLSQGGVRGNKSAQSFSATGIFKERNGMVVNQTNLEAVKSDATIHIRPDEAFLAAVGGNTVGHGIRASKNGAPAQDYRVIGQVEGYDFVLNRVAFYRLTLKAEALVA